MAFKSLRQRLLVLLLLPVALLLMVMGVAGFIFARDIMLDGWRETALMSLGRGAHSVDMRLAQPMDLLRLAEPAQAGRSVYLYQEWYLSQLRNLPGVEKVVMEQSPPTPRPAPHGGMGRGSAWQGMGYGGSMMFSRARASAIGLPRLEPSSGRRTVDIDFDLLGDGGERVGGLKVVMGFDYLLTDLTGLSWWKSQSAMLVDDEGRVLAGKGRDWRKEERLGQGGEPLEARLLAAIHDQNQGTILGPGHPPDLVAGFHRLARAPWTLVLIAPGAEVLAPIVRFRDYFLVAGLGGLAFVVLLIHLVTRRLVRPIEEVSLRAAQVAKGEYGDPLPTRGKDEIARLVKGFNAMVHGLKERDYVRDTFGRYMDPEVARQIMSQPEASMLGGVKREVAIMISDIRGFTPMCEALSPEGTIAVINRYLSGLIAVIQEHQGIIVDFLGDAILAFFDPLEGPCRPATRRAVCCALEMQKATRLFNEEEKDRNHPPIQIGIGINVGEVVVGNIGSKQRAKYGIIGAPVNYTHRLQSVAEGGQVVISDNAARCLGPELQTAGTKHAVLKGVAGEATLYLVEDLDACERS